MKNNYHFEKIYWQDFEDVVIQVSRDILGIAATKFSDGPDQGRDSTFNGTANHFPSKTEPWSGSFIIQAKHTDSPIASCSDNDFSGDGANSTISKELKRLKKLKSNQPFENYMLFTNRKLTADRNDKIQKRFKDELEIDNVIVIGKEILSSYITDDIARRCGLGRYIVPLRFYEEDIKEVITLFNEKKESISITGSDSELNLKHLNLEKKNELNDLSEDYFKFIKEHSLPYFAKIEKFLKDPINSKYTEYYENTVSDLQGSILTARDQFAKFDQVIEEIVSKITQNHTNEISSKSKLIRVFLHFMYSNCDIGKK